ncbi:MAG: hypothetical protein KGN79_03945 [Acidobacteriota bacterium]|nr:hypothetical protein [Acidobacteriota bacterium]
MHLGKRGFLDGYPGFAYSVLIAFYEFLIVLKTRELKAQQSGASGGQNQKSAS